MPNVCLRPRDSPTSTIHASISCQLATLSSFADHDPAMAAEITCESCGYSRRGLAADSLCPECGSPPPRVMEHTARERIWFLKLTIGLLLLSYCTLQAIQTTLIMPVGSFSLGVLNFPGPKLSATAVMEWAMSTRPGEWAAAGILAVAGQLVGIWLLTEPRTLHSGSRPISTVRVWLRWYAAITIGAALGLVLGNVSGSVAPMGNDAGHWFVAIVLLCETPSVALLYLHLRSIARDVAGRRTAKWFARLPWIAPAITGVGGVLVALDTMRTNSPPLPWSFVTAGYGAAALIAGVIGWIACVSLLIKLVSITIAPWISEIPWRRVNVAAISRQWLNAIDRNARRWVLPAGIALWLLTLPTTINFAARLPSLDHLPLVNFIGPKVNAAMLPDASPDALHGWHDEWDGPIYATLIAVWMMTVPFSSQQAGSQLRNRTRWVIIGLIGATVGVTRAWWLSREPHVNRVITLSIVACEVPCTYLLYLHLSAVASSIHRPQIARHLRMLAFAVPGIIAFAAIPLLAKWVMSDILLDSMPLIVFNGIYMACSTVVGMFAIGELVKLIWYLFHQPEAERVDVLEQIRDVLSLAATE